jgi:hypothetical protein
LTGDRFHEMSQRDETSSRGGMLTRTGPAAKGSSIEQNKDAGI